MSARNRKGLNLNKNLIHIVNQIDEIKKEMSVIAHGYVDLCYENGEVMLGVSTNKMFERYYKLKSELETLQTQYKQIKEDRQ